MKFSTASVVAMTAAFAPSLVSAANITVFVGASRTGQPGNVFDPQTVTAQPGDVVNFEFRGGNHTVTQSSFANPCAWQFNTVTRQNGFNSGFIPFDATTRQVSVFSLEVTDPNTPIWFFCGRAPHCTNGMFGAINPPTTGDRTFAAFAASARTAAEPGLGVTVPFTPPTASTSSGAAAPSNSNSARTSSGAASPTNSGAGSPSSSGAGSPSSNGATAPTQSSGASGSVTARSTVVLGLAGLVAGLVL
jgi:plastocyanin